MSTTSRKKQIVQSLQSKAAREAFVESQIETGVSFQIRANREARKWSQAELANRAEKKQPFIAKMEGPNHGAPNLRTLRELAAAFDVALIVRFVPFSEVVDWVANLPGKDLSAASFSEDQALSSPTLSVVRDSSADIASTGTDVYVSDQEMPGNIRATHTTIIKPAPLDLTASHGLIDDTLTVGEIACGG